MTQKSIVPRWFAALILSFGFVATIVLLAVANSHRLVLSVNSGATLLALVGGIVSVWYSGVFHRKGREAACMACLFGGIAGFAAALVFAQRTSEHKVALTVVLTAVPGAVLMVASGVGLLRGRAKALRCARVGVCLLLAASAIVCVACYLQSLIDRIYEPLWLPVIGTGVLGLMCLVVLANLSVCIDERMSLEAFAFKRRKLCWEMVAATTVVLLVAALLHMHFAEAWHGGRPTSMWLKELTSSDPDRRSQAVEALGAIADPAVSGLAEVVTHEDPEVRSAALDAIRGVMERPNRCFYGSCSGNCAGFARRNRRAAETATQIAAVLEIVRAQRTGVERVRAAYLTLVLGGDNWSAIEDLDDEMIADCVATIVEAVNVSDQEAGDATTAAILKDTAAFKTRKHYQPAASAVLLLAANSMWRRKAHDLGRPPEEDLVLIRRGDGEAWYINVGGVVSISQSVAGERPRELFFLKADRGVQQLQEMLVHPSKNVRIYIAETLEFAGASVELPK